ncbi:MAG: hypothetical protein NVSMB60_25820 [Mycobacterium sp.]
MSELAHERERLYRLVDEFIDNYSDDALDDCRIEVAIMCAALHFDTDDGEMEAVVYAAETRRRYVQIGVLDQALHKARATADPE